MPGCEPLDVNQIEAKSFVDEVQLFFFITSESKEKGEFLRGKTKNKGEIILSYYLFV